MKLSPNVAPHMFQRRSPLFDDTLRSIDKSLDALATGCADQVVGEELVRVLRQCRRELVRPISIAIMGEFNSGKSAIANRLLGEAALPTAVVACTHRPTHILYAEEIGITAHYSDGSRQDIAMGAAGSRTDLAWIDVGLPLKSLRDVEVWDMPGAGDRCDLSFWERRTWPLPDILIWCTACTQAWKDSERQAWDYVPVAAKQNAILVATFLDLLPSDAHVAAVADRLQQAAVGHFSGVVLAAAGPGWDTEDGSVEGPKRQQTLQQLLAARIGDIRDSRSLIIRRRLAGLATATLSALTP